MRYTIGQQIGDQGGFGTVHICTSETGDNYAIKMLHNMDNVSTERFKKEIRLTMRLSHPNVIKIIAYDADGPQKYYIMPLYSSSLIKAIPILYNKYDRQYSVISEILNGVIYLHSEGVLHRDLKPQNILYNSDSDVVINDFGLGRQIDSGSDRLTRIGAGFGTFRYTAPEQFNDASSVDERADIYSLGKILEDIVTNMLSYTIPTHELEYIISKCSLDNPQRRFQSVTELKAAIDGVYQHLLGIVERNTTDDLLAKIKLGNASRQDTHELAMRLLSHSNSDKLEEFFSSIPLTLYQALEADNRELVESLVIQLQQYYTGQGWGFGYTDTIGSNCERLYNASRNTIVRANLFYTIIEVGISHNRWYVMGIAVNLINAMRSNVAECIELANLLTSGRIYLNGLNLDYNSLPSTLQPCYEYKRGSDDLDLVTF